MKIGISIKIDVTKINKARLFQGQKGTYLDVTTFVDTEALDQYGNSGFISQDVSKEERESGVKGPILGNCKVFYKDQGASQQGYQEGMANANAAAQPAGNAPSDFDSDIPFAPYGKYELV